jgi:hypothetical protein
MPELTVKQIEEKFELKEGSLKEAVENDKPIKTEVKYFLKTDSYEELKKNSEEIGYKAGKIAGVEMPFKEFKKANPDIQAENFEDYIGKLKSLSAEQLAEAKKEVFNSDKAKELMGKIEALEKDKTTLQGTIKTNETLFNTQLAQERAKIQQEQIKTKANNYYSQIDWDVPNGLDENEQAKFVSRKTSNAVNLFLLEHTQKEEDGKKIWYKGDKALQNDTLEPLDDETVMSNWAKENYLKVTPRTGRGGKGTKVNMALQGINSVEDFQKYCKENNIPENSNDATAIWLKVKDKIN